MRRGPGRKQDLGRREESVTFPPRLRPFHQGKKDKTVRSNSSLFYCNTSNSG